MKKLSKFLSYVLVAALASGATFFVSGMLQEQSKLDQLEALIVEQFIGDADQTAIQDAAADAMVNALGDRWSYYLSAAEYKSYLEDMENSYVGIGVTITQRTDGLGFDVLQVSAGGSAEEEGILPGDIIQAVEGQDVDDLGMEGAQELIRGQAGTQVVLTVLRGQEELTFTLTRKAIITPAATGQMLPGNVGLVTIANFHSRSAEESIAAIEELLGQGAQSLIFDLRFNPGGYAKELVLLLDYLLPEGPLFRSVNYSGKESLDSSGESCLEMPMAVLVNGESYSASEFFAAAMQEYEAAVILGQKTVGKGYFQVTYELNDGSAVGLSVGKYFTPKGVSLDGVGVTPDIPVEIDEEMMAAVYAGTLDPMEDPQILAAVESLKNQK